MCHRSARCGISQRRHIVDHACAQPNGLGHHRGLHRIHRNRHASSHQFFKQRQQTIQFFLHPYWLGARTRRLSANIEQGRAGAHHAHRLIKSRINSMVQTISRKGVRGDIDDTHHEWSTR